MALQLPNSKRALIEKAGSSIFVAVAISSVIVAFSMVSINFLWDTAQYNDRVHDEKEEARDILISNVKNAQTLQASFVELEASDPLLSDQGEKSNSAVVLDALPRKYDFPALRTSIEKLAEMSSVTITSFGGSDEESDAVVSMIDPQPEEILFSVSIEGNYESLGDFIANTENTILPIKITRVRISGRDSLISASFDMVTYYQPSVDVDITTRSIQ